MKYSQLKNFISNDLMLRLKNYTKFCNHLQKSLLDDM